MSSSNKFVSRRKQPSSTQEESQSSNTAARQAPNSNRRASLKPFDYSNFAADPFIPNLYIRSAMEADTEDALNATMRSLQVVSEKSVSEMKRAVVKNHLEFLEVSKGIITFESNLKELKNLQNKVRKASQSLIDASGIASVITIETTNNPQETTSNEANANVINQITSPSNSANSSEINIRSKKMEELTEVIQGFEKYNDPQRYLVLEGGNFQAQYGGGPLHAGLKQITIYLFNDAIAIATRKSRLVLSSVTKKWSLERFWPLENMVITDITDSKNAENVIKLSLEGESIHLFAETLSAKRLWLQQMQKIKNSLKEVRKEFESDFLPAPTPQKINEFSPKPPTPQTTSVKKVSTKAPSYEIPKEKYESLLSSLEQLNEDINRCSYDSAVEIVDKLKYELASLDSRSVAVTQIQMKLQKQCIKLKDFLCHEISDLIIGKDSMTEHVQRLVVLGYPDEAREKFLAARSKFIHERTKHLRFTGDVVKTVEEIGMATFGGIATSAEWFISSFKDHVLTAGFIFWAQLEICNYVNLIAKQIFTDDSVNFNIIGNCLRVSRLQSTLALQKVGMDLTFYLDDQLLPHIEKTIANIRSNVEAEIIEAATSDSFDQPPNEVAQSCHSLMQLITSFFEEISPLMFGVGISAAASSVIYLVEKYAEALVDRVTMKETPVTIKLRIINALEYLEDDQISRISKVIDCSDDSRSVISPLSTKIKRHVRSLYKNLAEAAAESMVDEKSLFNTESRTQSLENMDISPWLATALPLYAKISRDTPAEHRIPLMRAILLCIIAKISHHISLIDGSIEISTMQQACLDIHFLLLCSASWLNEEITNRCIQICKDIMNKVDISSDPMPLPESSEYSARAQLLSSRYPLSFE